MNATTNGGTMKKEGESIAMIGHGEKFSRKMEEAIQALLMQDTILGAAEAVGIGEKTLRRWLKRPDFREAYDEARKRLFDPMRYSLAQAAPKAVQALERRMGDWEDTFRAATYLLDMSYKTDKLMRECRMRELELKIAELREGTAREASDRGQAEDATPARGQMDEKGPPLHQVPSPSTSVSTAGKNGEEGREETVRKQPAVRRRLG
jgi:hypothetical protein